ncbi:subtilisin-like protein [Fomitiporia mediterranea MF3/22]|uniref:subtilisin-like protein n=1 Tax=Fomitiporia mediterranea (strain MF3/22) TaxID=694068 RepID=UPI00044073CC|nr:subtilisin-like protein [Fomitiporia mediterranea MF3/22]EJD07658.1 subtilisin-like protein [Fomitiporia mediterranea MF3/22]
MLRSSTSTLWAFLVFPVVSLATPVERRWDDFEVKHAWIDVPRGWVVHSEDAAPDHVLDMRIGLKQDKFDKLVEELYQVSDPRHERYGAHLSKEDVEDLIAPHEDSVNTVEAWLTHHGISLDSVQRSPAGDWLTISIPVSMAERMLSAKYSVFHNPSTDSYVVRTTSYSLPSALHPHISVVAPTTHFGQMRRMKATSFLQPDVPAISDDEAAAQSDAISKLIPGSLAVVPTSCNTQITPACLRALYNTSTYVPQATDTNKLGVAGYLDEFANDADLQTFFQRFRTDAVGTTFEHVQVNGGGNDQSDPGVEANLDIQYTEGISFPTPNVYYSTGGSPPFIPDSNTPTNTNEPYLDWLNFILRVDDDDLPQTFTTSYGDDEQTVPFDFAQTVCSMFAQLGARGASIMFSSGDFGVGGGDCTTNDGTNTVRFQPIFPATCPFVTSVGGTIRVNPETAVDFSGGGFSNYFARPDYQAEAVPAFLEALGSQNAGLFNASGRGFPDVSAQGQNFQVVLGGRTISVGGTSASSPTFAGVISLLNDFRIAAGKAPLGFLNPLLYSTGVAGLNDITSGSNPGCNTNGFTAVSGWDPVTGLGTPDFGKLQAIVADA